jgi:hypothetical protein
MSQKLMAYFNKQPRLGILATANKAGKVNAAYFGSPQMVDEKTVVMGLGENRTLSNLRENPDAVYLIMEPGASVPEWKGVRIYLRCIDLETSGEKLDGIKAKIAEMAGEGAAQMIKAAVIFAVEEIRPLADFGQGWEQSVG